MVAPVPIRFIEIDGETKGFYQLVDKYIAIQPGMSEAQTMKTAVHETAHAVLHDRDQMEVEGIVKDQLTREVEAESVAYVVCNHFGLDTSEYSFSYIASWSSGKNMKELRASMDTIRKISADMIGQIEEKTQGTSDRKTRAGSNCCGADRRTECHAVCGADHQPSGTGTDNFQQ